MTDGDDRHKRSTEETLAWIAKLLNCPVEAFKHGAQGSLDVAQAVELLQLWQSISVSENRTRLLDFARQLAAS